MSIIGGLPNSKKEADEQYADDLKCLKKIGLIAIVILIAMLI